MKIPILNGIFTNNQPDFQVSYPVNMVPVAGDTGINTGYLKPHDGIVELGTGPGLDRGGVERLGVHYRVMGTKLVSIDADGNTTELGDIPGTDQIPFQPKSSYNFDLLSIVANGKLYYYNASGVDITYDVNDPTETTIAAGALFEVTDVNLGTPIDRVFLNGVFVVTDGEVVRSSSITNPTVFNVTSYEASEFDPDPVKALLVIKKELYVINRHSIELFLGTITGGDIYLPFTAIDGAQIERGCVGTNACCVFDEAIAFLGGGHNEPIGIYLGRNAQSVKISTRTIDTLLNTFTEAQLSAATLESRKYKNHEQLYVHLPDRTIVYDVETSAAFQRPVWFQLSGSLAGFAAYPAQRYIYAHGKWFVGNPNSNSISVFDETVSSQRGNKARWQFDTIFLYNNSNGALITELELDALTGSIAFGIDPKISTSYSLDGQTYSQRHYISAGKSGERTKQLIWTNNGSMRKRRIQRFEGDSDAHLSVARLEAQVEPLVY